MDDNECKICYQRPVSVAWGDCLHKTCFDCLVNIISRKRRHTAAICPFCRHPLRYCVYTDTGARFTINDYSSDNDEEEEEVVVIDDDDHAQRPDDGSTTEDEEEEPRGAVFERMFPPYREPERDVIVISDDDDETDNTPRSSGPDFRRGLRRAMERDRRNVEPDTGELPDLD